MFFKKKRISFPRNEDEARRFRAPKSLGDSKWRFLPRVLAVVVLVGLLGAMVLSGKYQGVKAADDTYAWGGTYASSQNWVGGNAGWTLSNTLAESKGGNPPDYLALKLNSTGTTHLSPGSAWIHYVPVPSAPDRVYSWAGIYRDETFQSTTNGGSLDITFLPTTAANTNCIGSFSYRPTTTAVSDSLHTYPYYAISVPSYIPNSQALCIKLDFTAGSFPGGSSTYYYTPIMNGLGVYFSLGTGASAAASDLSLSKSTFAESSFTTPKATFGSGETVYVKITVVNPGATVVSGATIQDAIFKKSDGVAWSAPTGDYGCAPIDCTTTDGVVKWTPIDINAGTKTFSYRLQTP